MNFAIIAAAGEGKRFSGKIPKLLLTIHKKPLLYYTISAFYDHPLINGITVVVNKKIKNEVEKFIKKFFPGNAKNLKIILGAKTRPESVLCGIKYIEKENNLRNDDILLIHNGANPLVSYEEISACIKTATKNGACIVAHKMKDTLKEINKKHIVKTHKRENFIRAQTPQAFKYRIIKDALKKAEKTYFEMTDEAMLAEKAGHKVSHINASANNFKITTNADYEHAKHVFGDIPDDFIFGIGQDSHAFSKKNGLVLGGFKLEKEKKLEADSDGDVVIHALCNAVLQAVGEKSLGAFADDLCKKQNVKDSKKYLEVVLKKATKAGFVLNNLGFMIEAKRPNIDKISNDMKISLSKITGLDRNRIGITATSGEKLTSFGLGKGIQCYCVASLSSKK